MMWKNPYMGVPIFLNFKKHFKAPTGAPRMQALWVSTLGETWVPFWKHSELPFWQHCGLPFWELYGLLFWEHYELPFWQHCGLPFWSTMGFHFGSIMGFHFVNARTSILGPRFHFGSHTRYNNMVMWISKLYSHVYPFLKRINSLLHVPCEPTGQSQSSLGCNGFSV